jgi:hypothetical protein
MGVCLGLMSWLTEGLCLQRVDTETALRYIPATVLASVVLLQLHEKQTVSQSTCPSIHPFSPPQNSANPRHQNDFGITEIYR